MSWKIPKELQSKYDDGLKSGLYRIYLIRCNLGSEKFYKVGVTRNGIFRRFNSSKGGTKAMPYNFKILLDEVISCDLSLYIEKDISNIFKSYNPKLNFSGCHECFVINRDIKKRIKGMINGTS